MTSVSDGKGGSSSKDDEVLAKDESDSESNDKDMTISYDRFQQISDCMTNINDTLFKINLALTPLTENKQDKTYQEEQEVCYENQILNLKQQIVFLEQKMKQKDRSIRVLKEQIAQRLRPSMTTTKTQNSASQTDGCRPTTAPILCTFDRERQANERHVTRCCDTDNIKFKLDNRTRINILKYKFLMDADHTSKI